MNLSSNQKFGPYTLISPLGEGGMGEVWKACDTRLDRLVAIKFSKAEFNERFKREARAVAALNHPGVCTVHDIGPDYLVMEFVDGKPVQGPLPLPEATRLGILIAEALDAAHRTGIVHRDLKPANILVTKSGVKLLDFGLAKSVLRETDATLTQALTQQGTIVGTLNYMSPEQLQAKETDARSDVFSFGLVLYEMLTGQRAFAGDSAASVIAAILERPAPSLAGMAPQALERVLQRCLAKDPDERWQTVRDLRVALQWAAQGCTEPVRMQAPRATLWWAPWALSGILATALGGAFLRAPQPEESKPLQRFEVDFGEDLGRTGAVMSPDGTSLAYGAKGKLFLRKLDQSKSAELPQTEGAALPFFSPDGRWIAFFAQNKLKKVPVEGGTAVVLCDAPSGQGGAWSEDGSVIAALNQSGGLSRIPAGGGTPVEITRPVPGETSHRWPQVLHGGKAVLFSANDMGTGWSAAAVELLSLADGHRKTLHRGGSSPRYLPAAGGSGYLTWITRGSLFAVPFDPNSGEPHGNPMRVLDDIGYSDIQGGAQLDYSRSGFLLYQTGATDHISVTGQWLDSNGSTQALRFPPGIYIRPRISPDGERIALEDRSQPTQQDIWVYEWKRDSLRRLTFEAGSKGLAPAWTPDGRYLVYNGDDGMYWIRADGGGKQERLTQSAGVQIPGSFTPDGKRLVFMQIVADASESIWTLPVESGAKGLSAGTPEPFLRNAFSNAGPQFSPDGHWLAYRSNESGQDQIYVRAFPDRGAKWQVSTEGGRRAVWSPSGHELFFAGAGGHLNVVSYLVKADSFVAEQPKVWSEWRFTDAAGSTFDIAPDGKRFFTLTPSGRSEVQQDRRHAVLLLNFADDLRHRLQGGN